MKGLASKLIFFLIVFFAGFATAIYMLAPVPENQAHKKGLAHSAFKSDEFAKSFNQKMQKCVDYSKNTAGRAGRYVKQKLNDK